VATGLNVAFMLSFTLLVSPYHGPDEGAHYDMIHQYQRDFAPKKPDRRVRFIIRDGPVNKAGRVLLPAAHGLQEPRLLTSDAPPRGHRPTLTELGRLPLRLSAWDQMSQHPPLYYWTAGAITSVLTVPDSFWSWDRELWITRLLSVLFVAPLALLASGAVLAIGLPRGVGAIAAGFTLLIPQKSFLGAVVNNDTLVMLLAAISVVAALRYLAGGSPRTAWAAGAAAGALALTKSTGAVVAAWTFAVVLYGVYERRRRGDCSGARRAFLGVTACIAAGSTWYVANVVRYHRPQPAPRRFLKHPVPTRFWTFVRLFLDWMSRTFWGRPAERLGVELPWWVSHTLSVLTVVAIVFAVIAVRDKRRYLVPLFVLCAAHTALLVRTNWRANRTHNGAVRVGLSGLQGRYFFPLLLPLAVLVAAAFWALLATYSRRSLVYAAGALIGLGTVLHAALAESMLVGYWQGAGVSFSSHLRALEAWSPLPVGLTVLVLALPFLVLAAAAAVPTVAWLRAPRSPAAAGDGAARV
jgi:4-amino-4-deoxy-L-arabinose transferase-like glycosyltransferase